MISFNPFYEGTNVIPDHLGPFASLSFYSVQNRVTVCWRRQKFPLFWILCEIKAAFSRFHQMTLFLCVKILIWKPRYIDRNFLTKHRRFFRHWRKRVWLSTEFHKKLVSPIYVNLNLVENINNENFVCIDFAFSPCRDYSSL